MQRQTVSQPRNDILEGEFKKTALEKRGVKYMRTLKYAILGLINGKEMTGYDISKEFGQELGNFWSAKHSQIYPELKKLLEEGLLEYKIEITGDILEKKVYSITEKGKKDFLIWLAKDERIEPTPKDQFRLRAYFSRSLEPKVFKGLLESQLEQRKRKLIKLNKLMGNYQETPSYGSEKFGDYAVLVGGCIREEATIKWLELCLSSIKCD